MKLSFYVRSLYRSPLKTILTLLILAAAAFLFLYNLAGYSVSDREYREARDKYEGVLTVEEAPGPDPDSTDGIEQETEDGLTLPHKKSIGEELIRQIAALPHISRVERRWLTAGVSKEYIRLDTDYHYYHYTARCVVTGTVQARIFNSYHDVWEEYVKFHPETEAVEYLLLEDVELLAGDPACLWDGIWKKPYEQHAVDLQIVKAEYKETGGAFIAHFDQVPTSPRRYSMATEVNHVYAEDAAILQPGRQYLLVLRDNTAQETLFPSTQYGDKYPQALMHQFEVGDDTLTGWWPYFTDITDLPENWLELDEFADLRELIRVTNDDIHTFDVVYCDDIAAQRRAAEGRMVCEEGRFITPADAGQPVCVVSTDFLTMSGLKIGDSITLDLGNYLSEQYASLGAVASARGRQNTAYTEQTFTIIGSWRDLNEGNHMYRDRFWCWSNNAIFVPTAFLPECRNAEDHEFKPGEISFVVGNAEEIVPFMEECLPQLGKMGVSYVFSDGGWSSIGPDLMQARSIALVKLLVFGGAAVFALVLTVWLFIGRKKREYAIYRALGMSIQGASMQLYIPFLMLGGVAAVVGAVAANVFSLRQLAASSAEVATAHTPAGPALYIFGAVGFLVVLAAFAWGGILFIRRRSVLELLSVEGRRRKKLIAEAAEYVALPQSPLATASSEREPVHNLGGNRSTNWRGRYLRRLLGRNLGRSALSLGLAALLAFAFGLITVLRGIYADLYQNVEVKAAITGGLSYDQAVKIADSGYVRAPFYEYVAQVGCIELEMSTIILTNRLDQRVSEPIDWLEGWDAEKAMNTDEKVLVMYSTHAEHFGFHLGDMVRVNEGDWWLNVTGFGLDPLKPGETPLERRDARRPFFQLVGIIQTEVDEKTAFIPAEARWKVLFLVPKLELDIAEYTLIDYHQAAEFTDYVKGQLDKSQNAVKFTMDTSYADQIYRIHQLIESLYPLAVAAALLLGGVLPGLIVLHGSREISILRALGVRARDCVILYTLSQVLCALAGLVLGIAAVLVALRPELGEVIVPFAIYLAAHLAACAIGSSVFAWLCARKRVLEQLQAKE